MYAAREPIRGNCAKSSHGPVQHEPWGPQRRLQRQPWKTCLVPVISAVGPARKAAKMIYEFLSIYVYDSHKKGIWRSATLPTCASSTSFRTGSVGKVDPHVGLVLKYQHCPMYWPFRDCHMTRDRTPLPAGGLSADLKYYEAHNSSSFRVEFTRRPSPISPHDFAAVCFRGIPSSDRVGGIHDLNVRIAVRPVKAKRGEEARKTSPPKRQ